MSSDISLLERQIGGACQQDGAAGAPELCCGPMLGRRLKILVVSWHFPPANTVGALRVGKLALHLLRRGHDVRVLTVKDPPNAMTAPLAFPENRITRARWRDVNAPPRYLSQWLRRVLGGGAKPAPATASHGDSAAPPGDAGSRGGGLMRRLSRLYTEISNIPDGRIGWAPYAIGAGRKLVGAWRPDVIFASTPPHSTLIPAARLGRGYGVPWIAEYRDRWVDNPYYAPPPWRLKLDRRLEDALIASAHGIVTVTDPWGEDYSRRWDKPVCVVKNGFDPDDFPLDYPRPVTDPNTLCVVYTGTLYAGHQDPRPLFRALAHLGDDAARVRLRFLGAPAALLRSMIAETGVAANVEVSARLPYRESIRAQMEADVLLLLMPIDSRWHGVCPAKVFEYIAARRPVLLLGLEDGVPGTILRQRQAGVVANDPVKIAAHLRTWLAEKRAKGAIPLLPPEVRDGLSRAEQFKRLERFLVEMATVGR
jgi:glycosyltransferase involved in cell wall biosynthesis